MYIDPAIQGNLFLTLRGTLCLLNGPLLSNNCWRKQLFPTMIRQAGRRMALFMKWARLFYRLCFSSLLFISCSGGEGRWRNVGTLETLQLQAASLGEAAMFRFWKKGPRSVLCLNVFSQIETKRDDCDIALRVKRTAFFRNLSPGGITLINTARRFTRGFVFLRSTNQGIYPHVLIRVIRQEKL